jgi:hypothetical protein
MTSSAPKSLPESPSLSSEDPMRRAYEDYRNAVDALASGAWSPTGNRLPFELAEQLARTLLIASRLEALIASRPEEV